MTTSPVVDSHFHVWELTKFDFRWPTTEQTALYRDISLAEYEENVAKTPVNYGVFVQVLHPDLDAREAEWILAQAANSGVVKGVVAGLDVTHPQLEEKIKMFESDPRFVGVRQILDFEDADWLLSRDLEVGLSKLQQHQLTFDLLLRPHLIQRAIKVVRKFPDVRFVVDHIAKPVMAKNQISGWREDIEELSQCQNVYCKISGLVTEAGPGWTDEAIRPFVEHVLKMFGPRRCMFGSDWPVCTEQGATYRQVYDLARRLVARHSKEEQDDIFGQNCIDFYKLQI